MQVKKIYLDNAATTPVEPEVKKVMEPYLDEKFGNAMSLHSFGREAKEAVEKSRDTIAKFVKCRPEEIYFTSGGTESDNHALKGTMYANKGKHLITSRIEHHAVLHPAQSLKKRGYKLTLIPVDKYGMVDPAKIEKAINRKTTMVSIMAANNEVGTIQPTDEIGKICKKKNVYFHTDAVQAFGKIPLNFDNIDMFSVSSHKIYGPKGTGLLYIKEGTRIEPFMEGGGQERKMRASTHNVPGIVGFAKAVEIAGKKMHEIGKKKTKLRDKLIKACLEIPKTYLNGHPEKRVPNNVHLSFMKIEGESLLLMLDQKGIATSTGSACSSGSLEPSHVLTAIDESFVDCVDPMRAHGSLRMTLGRQTTEKEIDYVIQTIPPIVERLRKMSPVK